MALDLENFDEVRIRGEEAYKNTPEVFCPYFREKISFNSQGLTHLKFKNERRARPRQDQYMRMKLLHLAPLILGSSATLQGVWEKNDFERVRVHNRTDRVMVAVTYYEFIAVIEKIRVKVIIKQIGAGEKFFWSIIPFWGIDKNTKKRRLCSGCPEED